ncbi:MAG: hypothetical protein A2504_16910 [Bdellovibrionales bacterium RIFOXYD12_FULL_39_22]|nr:MAG: hypothetical protein A2385_05850 [Bdellovibrionales bacterium RIFOXYB1_FULL_39_21]OFZ41476.1 MAG: hypothetical protein A2485_04600 [Bdellovibrionales bacterium RIFOXYC12_FULL_39_17]OFZ50378.1 MAG: hypothetical protein A2404_02430 [Bdellovibrionales bacterium RIFOXYC1_FULL_39_130]OFZ77657.1 MAG: hypothetical protein A2560_16505 [Bdellovibrionales bacterium RIFOXYD1_FULL_39_84]OFZ92196.1 MAG: hypothetical protein A2504_16910 [Bdellovibrionales bacterium RIFOXYD12_FULL_39_22]HLE12707.1 HA
MKYTSLFNHVHNSLNPYRWALAMVAALMIAILFAGISLSSRLRADQQMAQAISPYLSTLIESSDRPELLRIVSSIAKAKESKVIITQDNKILATSESVTDLDTPFAQPLVKAQFFDLKFTNSALLTKEEIASTGATLYIMTPLAPSLFGALGIYFGTFFLTFLVSLFSARQMKKAIKKALRPLNQLHSEIEGLTIEELEPSSEPISIYELEEIRNTVRKTKIDLANIKDRLAEEKAKKLSAESYKRLIHDLHNPVAALKQMANISTSTTHDEETRQEASESIPRIADQILAQVTAAKKNLEEEPASLRETNLLTCVQEGIKQVSALSNSKKIISSCPDSELLIPHDPTLLKRAIVNLLENGIEAAKSTVRVSVQKVNQSAFIKICDDGPGMDEHQIPIFFQGRGQSGKAKRQAFGLSSTNHIVRTHGGKLIYRKSDLGGSSFEIRLGGP